MYVLTTNIHLSVYRFVTSPMQFLRVYLQNPASATEVSRQNYQLY